MSQEAIKTVREAAAAFNRGDLDAWLEYLADDIDYRAVEGALDDHGPIHGRDAVHTYAQDWRDTLRDTFDDLRVEPLELIDAGDDKAISVTRGRDPGAVVRGHRHEVTDGVCPGGRGSNRTYHGRSDRTGPRSAKR